MKRKDIRVSKILISVNYPLNIIQITADSTRQTILMCAWYQIRIAAQSNIMSQVSVHMVPSCKKNIATFFWYEGTKGQHVQIHNISKSNSIITHSAKELRYQINQLGEGWCQQKRWFGKNLKKGVGKIRVSS